ncbi:MAG: hypothetical protein EOO85_22720 [Pedobacter sp.]|nr:MAG: hypothetical protein EOO85_22720 [Pedobacter sp.]
MKRFVQGISLLVFCVIFVSFKKSPIIEQKDLIVAFPSALEKEYDTISDNNLLFFNGSKSIDIRSINPTKIQEIAGKPTKIENGFSEMDDDNTITYIYPDGKFIFLVKQKHHYIEMYGPKWSFGIKKSKSNILKFSPGNSLELLKKSFRVSYQNPINTVYINLGIKTPSNMLSDSFLSFEVDKSNNKIKSITLE